MQCPKLKKKKRQPAMQKLYFPLPEAPGCYLNVAAALCLSALQRRPLEEGMGMEQSRGTENHR